ncbi:capsular polysaccharide biosynthesis protein [Roseibacterium sp. SDUM158017]|uniref:capsular polysaccharide biosynthesis protein n=1 Tax=Roseicyclus salinarum TaxID=3036773 RepID=UPI0024158598|nr:capsular polysaccharide biosynthesis protein [Roseibacterium sp. SDUM158017]MDG4647435.1 capsular polysaccharide biosynthesis protein [Roseibacterium sp. SDUM158017]
MPSADRPIDTTDGAVPPPARPDGLGEEDGRAPASRRVAYHFNAGFLTDARVRRILKLAGYDLRLGKPGGEDDVLVWGHSPHAARGEAAAKATGAHLVRVEDAFLRSLHPGRSGDAPLGLVIDRTGTHFDATRPSDLETILARHPLDNTVLLDRAREAVARMQEGHLTKYAAVDPGLDPPEPGFVLVVDQTRGDASIPLGQANDLSFAEMLTWARQDHPDARIVIKAHPETVAGHRPGHFDPANLPHGVEIDTRPVSPSRLFEHARAVYTVSSQLGFEAILAGHRPVTFGVPFYAGWGLTDDRRPVPERRGRRLTRAQLAAAALVLYPVWYDPCRDRLCTVEDALGMLEAAARAWREDRDGYAAVGMRAWKRPHHGAFFGGAGGRITHFEDVAKAAEAERPVQVWAGRESEELRRACARAERPLLRVEDGFLRSRGLGASLVPPLSLVQDDLGIYYDPTRESRLERLIAEAAERPQARLLRAERLIAALRRGRITKYNLPADGPLPEAPEGRPLILVPGQVEDDASILTGAGEVATNLELLRTARRLHPQGYLVYKPHPDVEAGLRKGAVPIEALVGIADHVANGTDPAALLERADRVVTMTSGLGFEALVRGVPVTTLGAPFYAGWGLSTDLGPVPARRRARPSLAALVHATLIAYPRYHDPATGLPCPVEVAVERLQTGAGLAQEPRLKLLAKLQGWFSGQSWAWRR